MKYFGKQLLFIGNTGENLKTSLLRIYVVIVEEYSYLFITFTMSDAYLSAVVVNYH